ncbi:xaa-Pro aminopeptidase 1-like isoform X3 [Lineus longissimus]
MTQGQGREWKPCQKTLLNNVDDSRSTTNFKLHMTGYAFLYANTALFAVSDLKCALFCVLDNSCTMFVVGSSDTNLNCELSWELASSVGILHMKYSRKCRKFIKKSRFLRYRVGGVVKIVPPIRLKWPSLVFYDDNCPPHIVSSERTIKTSPLSAAESDTRHHGPVAIVVVHTYDKFTSSFKLSHNSTVPLRNIYTIQALASPFILAIIGKFSKLVAFNTKTGRIINWRLEGNGKSQWRICRSSDRRKKARSVMAQVFKKQMKVEEYGTFLEDVKRLSTDPEVQFVWIDAVNNAGIMLAIGEQKVHEELNPVSFMKCVKNEVEQAGMKKAYLRDAVAFVDFMSRLEREVKSGITWTEMTAAKELLKYRRRLPLNMGASFETVSAVGEHAAIIHYQVNNDSDKPITTEEVYLVDSGGQYLDGTIDVTRTLHFGTPSDIEIDTYTRILMGSIDVASTIFIPGTYGRELAFVARRYLWEGGYDFWHGVGHGIGHFLHIHEGPVNLDISLTDFINTRFFEEGIFQTIEPGYYRLGKFGIRLESVVMVTQAVNQTLADRDYTTHTQQFYRFETISFIPFEPKMINFKMLSPQQITWLNEYNRQCRFRIGTVLWNQGKKLAYDWLMTKTEPILEERNCQSSAASVFTRIFELCFILTWSLLAVL